MVTIPIYMASMVTIPRYMVIIPMYMVTIPITMPRYMVTIETGPEKDMGTDADAYIILKAGEECSEELSLYHTGDEDEFEPGLKQEFEVESRDLGEITAIVVSNVV